LFLLGTAVFAGLLRFTPLGFLLSTICGIGAIILTRFIMSLLHLDDKKDTPSTSHGKSGVDSAVNEGMEKLRQISNNARLIQNNEVAAKIREICKIGVDIFDFIKKNPQDLSKARQFTLYYIDATRNIVQQYVDLSSNKEKSQEMNVALEKVEAMLYEIKNTYKKQLAYLYEHSLLDLNAEITLLKKTMELEK